MGRSGGGDLIDGNGKPWDVKDASAGSDQIVDVASPKGGRGGEDVLVDASKLSEAELKALQSDIASKLPPDAKDVRFVPKK
jgi:hypothetical protein